MMEDESTIERIVRAANPARSEFPRPTAAALARRDRIMRTAESKTRRARRVRAGWIGAATAAVAVTAVVFASVLVPRVDAVAGTPEPLKFTGDQTAAQIIDTAQKTLADVPGPAEPQRKAETVTWAFMFDAEKGKMVDDGPIRPEFTTFTWEPDLTGRVVVKAIKPYLPGDQENGRPEIVFTDKVLRDDHLTAEENATPVVEPPGDSVEDVRAMLTAYGMPENPKPGDVTFAVNTTLGWWTLTNKQQIAVLDILAQSGKITALGVTKDRLGRPVAGLSMPSSDGYNTETLLISLDTGRIVGNETRRTKFDKAIPIPKGTIIGYILWDVSEGNLE